MNALTSQPTEAAGFRQEAQKEQLLTWEEKRRYLARLVNDPETPTWIVPQAIQFDNKMAGHDQPEVAENDGPEPVLKDILENLKPPLGPPSMPEDVRREVETNRPRYDRM